MTNEDYPMGANQKEWRDGSNDPLVIDADTKVDITVSEQGDVATFRVPDLQTLDEIIAHLTTLRAVFGTAPAVSVDDVARKVGEIIAAHEGRYWAVDLQAVKELQRFIKEGK